MESHTANTTQPLPEETFMVFYGAQHISWLVIYGYILIQGTTRKKNIFTDNMGLNREVF